MFWKFDLHTSSHLEALLDKEDVTLTELMDEEDVLQECKAQNRRLLLFLCQDQCMQELVFMITTEPPAGVEETKRFKYPNIACELLTCDVGVINDKLGNEEPLLETLYAFLEQPSPLNPLLASFFSKTIGNLITRKTEQVISFLRRKEGFLSLVLKHIDTSAMMDVLLRLISCVEPPLLRLETLTWLNEEKLAQRLIELIHPERDEERQSNASQTLCDIIRLSRDQANQLQEISQPDPLLTVLESQESVEQLLQNMFSGERTESCIVNGIQVLLTLLEIRRPVVDGVMDAQGFERSYTINSSILLAIEPHLTHFHQLLLEPPKRNPMLTTLGVLEEPLGNTRLHVARLVASLLYTSSASHAVVAQELCRLNTMDLLLDLFFKYTWNNFLHLQVELCVAAILRPCAHEMRLQPGFGSQEKFKLHQDASQEQALIETPTSETSLTPDNSAHNLMVTHLFQHCHLVQRILEAWEENDKIQSEGGMRRGYMGHLTRIANTVVHNLEKGPVHTQISGLITELPEEYRGRWETFVDQTLSETNKKNTIDLVGTGNPRPSSEDDMESPFPKELTIQQAFSDYQIQQMTANFVDQFGFNDEEFTDHDDSIGATFDRIAEININIDGGQDSANTAVFEACSKERIQPFDDDEEDIWEEKAINYATQTKSRNRFGGSQSSQSQADSKACDRTATSGTEVSDRAADSDSDEGEESKDGLDPFSSQGQTEATKSTGWIADFGEVNSKAPAAGGGFAAWDTPASQPAATDAEEKGWAKFTDFQPFCCSETGPRCSSPVDSELSGSDNTKPNQNPCVWSVCVARKAPLVASDSSSSSSSDSDEEEGKTESTSSETVTTETITTGAGKETIRLTVDAKNERAVFTRVFRPAVRREAVKVPIEGLSVKDKGKGDEKQQHGDCPNPTTASPSNQSTAVTQETEPSTNGPA
ncbi:serine/threonine-protein phosphatase 6 regulatory subunit 2-like isoform X1 [Seriola lalandi dorsalis]|uniref:serine/threonine-protein phosphatase 6 regulatory subunit 2-like isoform X1 n=1 Tax=Seriola lalandi dorsalis TaxID=1841481 RepID=UPI000C6FAA21|nr:serine/threonine-protein phosphatase 6 regulatory subunit 2-like isoform X1 [Seriola lalandi dorsalis]XP_023259701.1 serine/threonine-protein phosphatase 6 regulatory subunit 2-like isoform X1 [Seriola lalandi dorsalis]XP_056243878.1 serine/threonine-protein phosphatase 6 regulatory subunit 2 isoform X1 [Seriola aureovittata]XP_056243879.1 serine/threonine-protein phosphatase 6 regulatory subunit 2 isoform X1 [Seriola aureovittata]XP_056243880.1 serine/threonine-protein phosphatase 6 regulat